MCGGVTKGFAILKFSESIKRLGVISTMTEKMNSVSIIPRISLIVK